MRSRREYFATWLDRTLTERGIAGGEVARTLGTTDGTVSKWRNGRTSISLDSAMKLATYLGVDAIQLAVTAGLMDTEDVGVSPLPLPEDTQTMSRAREHIMKMNYLTREDREILLKTLGERYSQ